MKWPTAASHPDYVCVAVGAPEGQGTHHQSERRKTNQDPGIGCWLSKRAKRFLSLCTGATAHLHCQKTLAQEIVSRNLEENQVCRVPHFFSLVIELCWRKQTGEWGVGQLWLNLFLMSVHHPQVNIRFTFCAFFSTGSWAFSPSGSLGLQENTQTFKKKIKVKKYYGSTLYCHLGSPCLFFTP